MQEKKPFYLRPKSSKSIYQKTACEWRNFKIIFSTPLFIIIFRTKILFSGPYSILTGHTKVESVVYQVLSLYCSFQLTGNHNKIRNVRNQSQKYKLPIFFFFEQQQKKNSVKPQTTQTECQGNLHFPALFFLSTYILTYIRGGNLRKF